jgi:hypothetical protein
LLYNCRDRKEIQQVSGPVAVKRRSTKSNKVRETEDEGRVKKENERKGNKDGKKVRRKEEGQK